MDSYITPTIVAASVISGTLIILGAIRLVVFLSHRARAGKNLRILKIEPEKLGVAPHDLLKLLKPPVVFEIAIHQLGRRINYYLAVPAKRSKGIIKRLKAVEVPEYSIYHPGGYHLGLYLKDRGEWPAFLWDKIDFSKIDAIGESVTIQLVLQKRQRRETMANFRVVISAPSPYRAEEILSSLKPIFSQYKIMEAKSSNFLQQVDWRKFDDKELIWLS